MIFLEYEKMQDRNSWIYLFACWVKVVRCELLQSAVWSANPAGNWTAVVMAGLGGAEEYNTLEWAEQMREGFFVGRGFLIIPGHLA